MGMKLNVLFLLFLSLTHFVDFCRIHLEIGLHVFKVDHYSHVYGVRLANESVPI